MNEMNNIPPLVDILSKQLNEQVVMISTDYVLMRDKSVINQSAVDIASDEQNKYAIKEAVTKFTRTTDQYIQAKVDQYNKDNNTAFTNVHNCENYSRVDGYTHQEWCGQVWRWSVRVWERVRANQATMQSIPSDALFQKILDGTEW